MEFLKSTPKYDQVESHSNTEVQIEDFERFFSDSFFTQESSNELCLLLNLYSQDCQGSCSAN